MPNGHGGGVRFYSVVVLLLFAAGLFVYDSSRGAEWAIPVGYGLILP